MKLPLNPNTERLVVITILALAVTLRVIAAIIIPDQSKLLPDVVEYRDSATQLLNNWQLVSNFHMPLYPLLVAMTGPGVGQLGADIVLSVILVWLVYALADQLFADQYARIFAAIAAASYPPLIYFSVVGLSETLFSTLVLSAFLCWYRAQFIAAAIFAALAILTRQVFDPFAPVLLLLFALVVHQLPVSKAARHLGIYVVIYCALMAPWWLNNYTVFGSFVRLTPSAGTVLYAGNNPLNHSGGGNLGVDYDPSAFTGITDPLERDRALRNAAVDYIIHNPQRFLELAALKFLRIWRVVPAYEAYRNVGTIVVSIASFVPMLLLAILGLFVRRDLSRRLSPVLLFAGGYTLVHMILVGTIRYRLPLEPFMIVFAGAGVSYLLQRAISSSRQPA
jgi:4-amino-4-deoxy-L-arabinose transferase-like glycosyltransferase